MPLKNIEQQATLALHRVRQNCLKARTTQANQIRGLSTELGVVVPRGISFVLTRVPGVLEDAEDDFPHSFRALILRSLDYLTLLSPQVDEVRIRSELGIARAS